MSRVASRSAAYRFPAQHKQPGRAGPRRFCLLEEYARRIRVVINRRYEVRCIRLGGRRSCICSSGGPPSHDLLTLALPQHCGAKTYPAPRAINGHPTRRETGLDIAAFASSAQGMLSGCVFRFQPELPSKLARRALLLVIFQDESRKYHPGRGRSATNRRGPTNSWCAQMEYELKTPPPRSCQSTIEELESQQRGTQGFPTRVVMSMNEGTAVTPTRNWKPRRRSCSRSTRN